VTPFDTTSVFPSPVPTRKKGLGPNHRYITNCLSIPPHSFLNATLISLKARTGMLTITTDVTLSIHVKAKERSELGPPGESTHPVDALPLNEVCTDPEGVTETDGAAICWAGVPSRKRMFLHNQVRHSITMNSLSSGDNTYHVQVN